MMSIRILFEKYFKWCPMSPDLSPPQKDGVINMLDDFLAGWRNYIITISLLSILLASSLILTPPPLISISTHPDTWNKVFDQTPKLPDPIPVSIGEPDITISEQTIIEDGEVLSFSDKTIWVKELLLLRGKSSLVVQNCTIIVPESPHSLPGNIYFEQAGILFNDSSILEAVDSTFVSLDRYGGIGFIGSSQCVLDNVVVANCSLNLDEGSQLHLNRSRVARVNIDNGSYMKIDGSYVGELDQQSNRWRSHWLSIYEIKAPRVDVIDSVINFAEIRVINSSKCNIDGEIGYHSYWNPYSDWQIDGQVLNLTLKNSEIKNYLWVEGLNSVFNVTGGKFIWLFATMSEIYCNDAELWGLSIAGNSSAVVKNSNIYNLGTSNAHAYSGEFFRSVSPSSFHQTVNVSDSRIEHLSLNGYADINCENVYIADARIGDVVSAVSGSVTWGDIEGQEHMPYNLWALKQTYTINTIGEEFVLPGVELRVTDVNGETLWSGVSDENGVAEIDITYCSYYPLEEPYHYVTNYMEAWNLTGVYKDEVKTNQISIFETNSPITLDYSKDVFTLPIDNNILLYSSITAIFILSVLKLRFQLTNKKIEPFGGNTR